MGSGLAALKETGGAPSEGNAALSHAVWGDPTFELIGFLEDVASADVTRAELKAALRYEPGYIIGRESVVPSIAIQDAVIAGFGSAEAFRDAVVGHVGTPPLDQLPQPTRQSICSAPRTGRKTRT